jgi:hypothetical protein
MRVSRNLYSLAVAFLMLAAGLSAQAAEGQNADWPCQQGLVPDISPAVVWDGPSVEGLVWRDQPEVAVLVERIIPSQTTIESAEQQVASFAAALPRQDKDRMLTLLFAGVLEALNQDRSRLINGIQRYSRDQARRAEEIGKQLDELVGLERATSEDAASKAQALRARLELQERVFDERERSIRFLCLRPVAVEERLGALARMIAGHLRN